MGARQRLRSAHEHGQRRPPRPPLTIDDEVVLLAESGDDRNTAAELALRRTTIRWEAVTQMAAPLPRVYHAASVPVEIRSLIDH